MPAYFVVENEATNETGFAPYRAAVNATLTQYGGRFLTRRPGSIQGCRDSDHADGSDGVPPRVAASGGSDGVGHYTDGPDDLGAGSHHD